MIIPENTEMMLFRYSNYHGFSFIEEHMKVVSNSGYVWMLKTGRKSKVDLYIPQKDNTYLVLKSPKSEGSKYYISKVLEIKDTEPLEKLYPEYYAQFRKTIFYHHDEQWFKLKWIKEIDQKDANSLTLIRSGKKVSEVVSQTRTAFLFVKNELPLEVS